MPNFTTKTLFIATAVVLGASAALAAVATGDTSKDKIALSNSFAGNTFRQQQLKKLG